MTPVPITQVDAFTSEPFAGNPAAVCLLPEARDTSWMQSVAREMNLSETAFLLRQARRFPGKTSWTKSHERWIADQRSVYGQTADSGAGELELKIAEHALADRD